MQSPMTGLCTERDGAAAAGPLIVQFAYLQGLDMLTTLAFLLAGVQEANPLVRAAIAVTGAPLVGLVAVKGAALVMGAACWRSGRVLLLKKANLFFAALVAWNLVCLILGLGRRM